MAMIYATITGTITRPGSNVGVRARITATPLTTNQALTFTGDDRITIGPETAETNGSGTLSTLKIPTNVDVGALLWRITAEALDRGPGPSRWTVKNAVAITGSSTIKLKDLVEVDVITVDAAIVTNVSALVADADSSKTAAAGSATAAAGSASAAATSASAAAGSATGASGSASAAATSASTASTKAGEASGSATAAAGSASAAAASASHADAMAGAAEAVAVSNDTIIAGRINDSASATATALTASFAQAWKASTAYTAGQAVTAPDGSVIARNSSGTSRASFDATEQAAWTPIISKAGTLAQIALADSIVQGAPYGNGAIPPPVGTIVSSFQSTDAWVDSAGGWAADTSNYIYGTRSWKATSNGAGGAISTYLEFPTPVDIRGMNVLLDAALTNRDHVASFNVSVDSGASGFSALMQYQNMSVRLRDQTWDQYLFPYSTAFDQTGTPNRAAVKRIRIRLTDDNTGNPVTLNLNRVRLVPNTGLAAYPGGVGTIDFDDCYDSVALAHNVLSKYGVPGVVNVIVDNMDTAGHLTTQQLIDWARIDGWGVQAHAYTGAAHNTPYTGLTVPQMEVECRGMKTWLRANAFDDEFFVYPTGAYNDTVISVIRKHFRAARTTDSTPCTMPGVRNHRLSSLSIGPTTTTADVKGYMDTCVASGLPFHLTLHKFVAGGATSTPLAWGTDQLDEVIAYALGKGYSFARYPDIYGGKNARPSQVLKVNTISPATDGLWRPRDSGFIATSFMSPLGAGSTTFNLVSGQPYVAKIKVDQALALSKAHFIVSTAGTGTGLTGSFHVFDSTGTRLAVADISAALAAAPATQHVTFGTIDVSTPRVVGEWLYVVILATWTGGTAPALRGIGTTALPNFRATTANSDAFFGTLAAGATPPLASIDPSTISPAAIGGTDLIVAV